MLCNETAFNPVQAWLSGFAALCRSTTTVGTASIHHAQATQMFGEKASVSGLERCPGCHPEPFAEFTLERSEGLRVTGLISKCLSACRTVGRSSCRTPGML